MKSNAVLLTIVLASHLVNTILWYYQLFQLEYSFIDILYNSASLIFCIDLIVAYAFRYRSHKEAGLADKN